MAIARCADEHRSQVLERHDRLFNLLSFESTQQYDLVHPVSAVGFFFFLPQPASACSAKMIVMATRRHEKVVKTFMFRKVSMRLRKSCSMTMINSSH